MEVIKYMFQPAKNPRYLTVDLLPEYLTKRLATRYYFDNSQLIPTKEVIPGVVEYWRPIKNSIRETPTGLARVTLKVMRHKQTLPDLL